MREFVLKSERVKKLRESALSKFPGVSVERGRLLTKAYKEHEGKSKYIVRAYAVKEILEYDRDSSAYFLKVLDSSIPLEELVKQPSKMKDYEEPHQDLYQTNLLEAIQQRRPNNRGFTYHFWGVHILYPPYYSGDYYGCIIGEERNKKLAQAVTKGIINTKQQLEWNDEKLPFFWGWNIHFTYDDKEYVWWYKGQITNNEGEDCTEEILKIFE